MAGKDPERGQAEPKKHENTQGKEDGVKQSAAFGWFGLIHVAYLLTLASLRSHSCHYPEKNVYKERVPENSYDLLLRL